MAKGHHPQQRLDGFRHGLLKLVVAGAEGGLDGPQQGLEIVGRELIRAAGLKLLLAVAALQVKAAISKQGKPCDELIVGGVHGWNGVRRD
jgi:hypothetical protein